MNIDDALAEFLFRYIFSICVDWQIMLYIIRKLIELQQCNCILHTFVGQLNKVVFYANTHFFHANTTV